MQNFILPKNDLFLPKMNCISPKVASQNLVFRLKKFWTLGEIQIVKKSLGEIQGTLHHLSIRNQSKSIMMQYQIIASKTQIYQ